MDSKVWAFELRDDQTVNKKPVSLTFPRPDDSSLYIITNEKSKFHLLQEPANQKNVERKSEEKKLEEIFQYGGSTKVFSVTNGTERKWEVRLLLSPSEVNRLSSAFNLIGYLSTCLITAESHEAYEKLLHGGHKDTAKEICRMIAPFFCLPEGDMARLERDCCTKLEGMVKTRIIESCKGKNEAMMVAGGLTALMAAELASSFVAYNTFDYTGEKTESEEDLKEKIDQMVKASNIQAELLVVSHRGKSVFIIFRNPCSDNWASGGRKRIRSKETFEFGLSHKVFSISGSQSKIQLLQSLQESYDMIAVFHIAAFAEHLLMTEKWRKALDVLLKDGQNKETITELSQFAVKFVCSGKCKEEIFLSCFKKEMRDTLSKVKTLKVGSEAISVFGLLVAIMAALKAKAIADNLIKEIPPSSDDDTEPPLAPESPLSKVDPDSNKGDLPKTQDVVHPEPETIGANLKGNDDTVNEEAATGNKGGISGGLRVGLGGKNVDLTKKANSENNEMGFSKTSRVGEPETITLSPNPDDIPQPLNEQLDLNNDNLVIRSDIKTTRPLGSPVDGLSATEPQSPEEPQSAEKRQSAEKLQGLPEITSTVDTLNTCNDDRQDQDEVKDPGLSLGSTLSKTSVGLVHDPDSGSGTTYDEDTIENTTLDVPTPTLDLNISGEESLTLNSQKYPSTPISQERNALVIDQLGQRPDHLSDVDQGGEDTSNRSVAQSSSFPMPLIILILALVIVVLFILPSQWTYVFFTGLALMLGAYLFLSSAP